MEAVEYRVCQLAHSTSDGFVRQTAPSRHRGTVYQSQLHLALTSVGQNLPGPIERPASQFVLLNVRALGPGLFELCGGLRRRAPHFEEFRL